MRWTKGDTPKPIGQQKWPGSSMVVRVKVPYPSSWMHIVMLWSSHLTLNYTKCVLTECEECPQISNAIDMYHVRVSPILGCLFSVFQAWPILCWTIIPAPTAPVCTRWVRKDGSVTADSCFQALVDGRNGCDRESAVFCRAVGMGFPADHAQVWGFLLIPLLW